MIGRVVSTKMTKTVVVLVEGQKTHRLYKKSFVSSKRFLAHDELEVKDGDIVEILKVRPISKKKHWNVTKIIGRDLVALGTEELKEDAREAIEEVLPEESEEKGPEGPNVEEQLETVEATTEVEEVKEEKKPKAKKAAVKKAKKEGKE